MKKFTNTFTKGLQQDIAKNKYGSENYYNAENFRILTEDGLSSGALENVSGNIITGLQLPTGYQIHGYTNIRNKFIALLVRTAKVSADTTDRIIVADVIDGNIPTYTNVYSGDLGFLPNYPVTRMIGRFESNTIQKVYWTDRLNFKFCNIADPNINTFPSSKFDLIPNITMSLPIFTGMGSGNLKTGKVQYAYQLYNINGAETLFSPVMQPVHITSASESLSSDLLYQGENVNVIAGKSVSFRINNVDTNFQRIRIVRIFHTDTLTDPTIEVIAELSSTATVNYTDTGSTGIYSLTVNEFREIFTPFIPDDLEVKNNYLFASGIKESTYDVNFDARAYRFAGADNTEVSRRGYAGIWDASAGFYEVAKMGDQFLIRAGLQPVPETHDCINYYNRLTSDTQLPGETRYRYWANQTTLGGEGPNIRYKFGLYPMAVDIVPSEARTFYSDKDANGYTSYANPYNASKVGYCRDEIYRFGIVFHNKKGQKSFVKWIADIRMPKIFDSDNTATFTNGITRYDFATLIKSGTKSYACGLYLNFEVKNVPTDAVGYEIVRMPRTSLDRTVLAQGIGGGYIYLSAIPDVYYPGASVPSEAEYSLGHMGQTGSHNLMSKTFMEISSPEVNFGVDITYNQNDRLDLVAKCTSVGAVAKINSDGTLDTWVTGTGLLQVTENPAICTKKINGVIAPIGNYNMKSVLASSIIEPTLSLGDGDVKDNATTYSVGGNTLRNVAYRDRPGSGDQDGFALRGKHLAVKVDQAFSALPTFNTHMIFNYRRPTIGYGGDTYSSKQNNVYISTGTFIKEGDPAFTRSNSYTGTAAQVFGGDTYISMFDHARVMIETGRDRVTPNTWQFAEFVYFPVETSININLNLGDQFHTSYTTIGHYLINEKSGVKTLQDGGALKKTYVQEKNMYSYNSVYSKPNNINVYIPKPPNLNLNTYSDVKVQYSDKKYNNESVDSWTKFRVNNFIEVDGSYGKITSLQNYNSDLYFFQPSAIGVLSVEEREVVQSSNMNNLTVGTGGVLSRFDYVSTAAGCEHPDSIIKGVHRMSWYDKGNNILWSFDKSEGMNPNSKILGINSKLAAVKNNITNVIAGYDTEFNEVLFTFKAGADSFTIVYNELIKVFTGFYTINPLRYLNIDSWLYSIESGPTYYRHTQAAEKGKWYDNYRSSKITLIINPQKDNIVRFDWFEINTQLDNYNETISYLRAMNSYQDTSLITLVPNSNIKKVFNKWRFNSLRDAWAKPVTAYFSSKPTMKDYYLQLELNFTNSSNKRLVLRDVDTVYSSTSPY